MGWKLPATLHGYFQLNKIYDLLFRLRQKRSPQPPSQAGLGGICNSIVLVKWYPLLSGAARRKTEDEPQPRSLDAIEGIELSV